MGHYAEKNAGIWRETQGTARTDQILSFPLFFLGPDQVMSKAKGVLMRMVYLTKAGTIVGAPCS